jgi:hypothetical protein
MCKQKLIGNKFELELVTTFSSYYGSTPQAHDSKIRMTTTYLLSRHLKSQDKHTHKVLFLKNLNSVLNPLPYVLLSENSPLANFSFCYYLFKSSFWA